MSFQSVRNSLSAACLLFAILAFSASAKAEAADYELRNTWHLAGPSFWSAAAFDPSAGRLYIAQGGRIAAWDAGSKKAVGTTDGIAGVSGIALASEYGRGFSANAMKGEVVMFDLETMSPFQSIPVGKMPAAVAYDPASHRAFVSNGIGHDMTVIDGLIGQVIGMIDLAGMPGRSVADGYGKLYVLLEDKTQVAVVDTAAMEATMNFDLRPDCDKPVGLAVDAGRERLFVSCSNDVLVALDAKTGGVIDRIPVGARAGSVAFDPDRRLVFVSSGVGTLAVIGASSPDKYRVLETVRTKPTARMMALDTQSHALYLIAATTEGLIAKENRGQTKRLRVPPNNGLAILEVRPQTQTGRR